ncbi:hypothetical protein, partial [Nitrosomonas sp.]|uniref:hypothetical protein n=1 Tax=Nitrosomonas sp. TaxID=42353 RepID=UPI0035B0229C
ALLMVPYANPREKYVSILARLWGRALQYNCNPIIQQRNFLFTRELGIWGMILGCDCEQGFQEVAIFHEVILCANQPVFCRCLRFADVR